MRYDCRTFRLCDDNGNKQLNMEEFKWGFEDYGVHLKDDELRTLFNAFDKDGSGQISFDEFLVRIRVRYDYPLNSTENNVMIPTASDVQEQNRHDQEGVC